MMKEQDDQYVDNIDEAARAAELAEYNAKEQSTAVRKCPNCGANLVWSPVKKCLYCEHCTTSVEIDLTRFGEELNFSVILKDSNTWADETHVYRCNNCGAKEVLAKSDISTICSFCGTTNVVETQELPGLKPNAVIPFNLTKENACDRVKAWAKKKIFAPKAFKKSVYPEEMHGNYMPVFTFDTNTYSDYYGVLGEYYYVTIGSGKNSRTVRRTRYKNISGNFTQLFDDILVQASDTITQKTVDKLQPFNTNTCNSYSQEFLHGFTASQYVRDGMECWTEARNRIEVLIKQAILAQYSYDFVQSFSFNTSCNNITFKYLLLPIFVGHCNWKSKLYNFYVNGRSGKIVGKTPLSPLKVSLTSIILALLAGGLAVLGFYIYTIMI